MATIIVLVDDIPYEGYETVVIGLDSDTLRETIRTEADNASHRKHLSIEVWDVNGNFIESKTLQNYLDNV